MNRRLAQRILFMNAYTTFYLTGHAIQKKETIFLYLLQTTQENLSKILCKKPIRESAPLDILRNISCSTSRAKAITLYVQLPQAVYTGLPSIRTFLWLLWSI